jgi:hypothetical protein
MLIIPAIPIHKNKIMEITLNEFNHKIEEYTKALEHGSELSVEDYISIGYLWNTLANDKTLMESISGKRFYEIVRDNAIPKMVEKLKMKVSRGYSFHSKEFDFVLGGIMQARFRYEIKEKRPTNSNKLK